MLETEIPLPAETFFHSRFFRGLCADELKPLAQICSRKQIPAGTCLVRQHSPALHVYTVISGALMLERCSRTGKRQVIGFSFPGDTIGITSNDTFEYSVVALKECHLQVFHRQPFLDIIDGNNNLKNRARITGCNILTHTLDQLFALGQKKAHERLCFLLQQISQRQPGCNPEIIDLIMNRQDIADYLGLTIETVSRAFTKLRTTGVIQVESAHKVRILDRQSLEEMASAH